MSAPDRTGPASERAPARPVAPEAAPRRAAPGGTPRWVPVAGLAGLALFLLCLLLVGDARSAAPGDLALRRLTVGHEGHALIDIAHVVTDTGTWAPVLAALIAAGVLLWRAGRPRDALALGLGYLLGFVVVHATKGAVDRPRPGDRLVHPRDASFPSGHTANAIAWASVSLALAPLARAGRRPWVAGAGILLAVLVGASRIVLRAHWLSDVVAAAGISVAAYAVAWWLLHRPPRSEPAAG